MLSKALLSMLIIAVLFVSIFSPCVEASIVYGPNQYHGDWYLGPQTNNGCSVPSNPPIANGSNSIANGSKPLDTPMQGKDNGANPSIAYYSGPNTFPVNDNKGSALDDYKKTHGPVPARHAF
jgi:hypothetical protein